MENPTDCASRGLFPSKLLNHSLWWNGPTWLKLSPDDWPKQLSLTPRKSLEEEREMTLHAVSQFDSPIISLDHYSNFYHLKYITVWILGFIENCYCLNSQRCLTPSLSTQELLDAEQYWTSIIQNAHFADEIQTLKKQFPLRASSPLVSLHLSLIHI